MTKIKKTAWYAVRIIFLFLHPTTLAPVFFPEILFYIIKLFARVPFGVRARALDNHRRVQSIDRIQYFRLLRPVKKLVISLITAYMDLCQTVAENPDHLRGQFKGRIVGEAMIDVKDEAAVEFIESAFKVANVSVAFLAVIKILDGDRNIKFRKNVPVVDQVRMEHDQIDSKPRAGPFDLAEQVSRGLIVGKSRVAAGSVDRNVVERPYVGQVNIVKPFCLRFSPDAIDLYGPATHPAAKPERPRRYRRYGFISKSAR